MKPKIISVDGLIGMVELDKYKSPGWLGIKLRRGTGIVLFGKKEKEIELVVHGRGSGNFLVAFTGKHPSNNFRIAGFPMGSIIHGWRSDEWFIKKALERRFILHDPDF